MKCYQQLQRIAMTNSKEYDDILSTLCVMNLLYNTGHSLQQLETIAKIKSQQPQTIMKGKCV